MADFLERVARMALGAGSAIQPLVLSRYAPGANLSVPETFVREVTLDASAEPAPTPGAELQARSTPSAAPPDLAGPRRLTQDLADAAPVERTEKSEQPPNVPRPERGGPAVTRNAPHAIAPGPVDAAASDRAPDGESRHRAAGETDHGEHVADDARAREQLPFAGEPRQPLPPPGVDTPRQPSSTAIVDDPRARVPARVTEAGAGREAHAGPRAVDEPASHTGPTGSIERLTPASTGREEPAPLPSARTAAERQAAPIRPQATIRASLTPDLGPFTPRRAADETRATRLTENGESSSQPVVRVTIGRVDVRAVMPPPPPPVEAAAAPMPRLSLDEYLRQHSGRPR